MISLLSSIALCPHFKVIATLQILMFHDFNALTLVCLFSSPAAVCADLQYAQLSTGMTVTASSSLQTANNAVSGSGSVWMPVESDLTDGEVWYEVSIPAGGSIVHVSFEVIGASSVKVLKGTLGAINLQLDQEVSAYKVV